METTAKKSALKTILTIAAGVVIALAVVKGAEWGIKKVLNK
jgi:hypothetical protein